MIVLPDATSLPTP